MSEPTVIVVAGPTAVGKTGFAIGLAQHFGTEIISADSRQCYREMKIGVARPSDQELAAVKHHFIASHSVTEDLNAGSFERYALERSEEIFRHHPVVVMVGGTGLYIKAFCEGIDPMPEVAETVRQEIVENYKRNGLVWLQRELQHKDPAFWQVAEQQNPQRLMRALEILNATGSSILQYRSRTKAVRPFRIIKIGLELAKERLHENIHTRVDRMMEDGLLAEVEALQPYRSHNGLQTVGYRELFGYLDGHCSLEQAVADIKTNTRQYAKRQMTWFRKDPEIRWMAPSAENLSLAAALVHA
ncbi:MAG: tRNA (adenosine(37)-N6)-dimethylallyltransferase MiaA [Chitinophagaceae bacterium]|nr:tRNA (adenosine(37)-N6)-dimethylallyltransferase MiaA [Chitinophagaceae bacterium]